MKPQPSSRNLPPPMKTRLVALLSCLPFVPGIVQAVTVTHLDNTNALNLTSAWNGGSAPTSTGTAVWTGAYTTDQGGSASLKSGGSLSWMGITVDSTFSNTGNAVRINATTAGTDVLTLASGGSLSVAAGKSLAFAIKVSSSGTVTKDGAGSLTFYTSGNTINNLVVNGGQLNMYYWTGGNLTLNSTSSGYFTGTGNRTEDGNISGVGAITFHSGTDTLKGTNTYSGNSTVDTAGVLKIGVNSVGSVGSITSSAIGTGSLVFNGGTVSSDGATARTLYNAISFTGAAVLGDATNNGALTFAGGADLGTSVRTLTINSAVEFQGAISGAGGGITKGGVGTLTLSTSNSYSGKTVVQNGTLSFNTGNTSATASQALGTNTDVDLGVASTSSGILSYTGVTGTLAKNINALGNGSDTIQNSGSGLLTLAGTLTKSGTVLTLKGGSNGITVSGKIAGTLASSDLVVDGGSVTLSNNTNDYNGPTIVQNNGKLNWGASNVIPGALTLNSGTANLAGYAETVSALTIGAGNGAIQLVGAGSAPLAVSGALTLTGNLTLDVNGTATTAGLYKLLSYGSKTAGGSVTAINANAAYNLINSGSEYDLQHKADQTLTIPSTINIIAGATAGISGLATLTNSAPSGSADMGVNLANNGGTGGTFANLSASTGATVTQGTPATISGTFTAGNTVGTGQTWSIKNTDSNAVTTSGTVGGTVNIYNHANGVLTLTSGTTVDAIAGATINSTLSFQNSGANNVKLTAGTLGGGLSGLTGDVTADQTKSGLAGSFTAGAAGTSGTHSYTAAYTEDTSVTGHNSGGTATANVIVNSYNHANGVLTLTSGTTVDAIAGATINSTLSFQNSGANNVKLTAGTLGGGLSGLTGDVTADQTKSGLAGSFTAGAAGTSGTHSYTAAYTEDTSVTGHNSGGTATAGVTVNSYDHAILAQADTTNAGSIDTFNVSNLVNGSARRAAADVSNISLSTSATGFTKGATGLVASDATHGIASFDTSDKLNGTYKVTASITATSKTASGGVITGASANDAGMSNVALSEVVGGKTAGAGVTKVAGIAASATYGGYNMTSTMDHGTKAELLGGTATADATVSMTFNTAEALSITDNASRVSDIVSISGMHQTGGTGFAGATLTDTFVLQLSYTGSDPAYLAWWDGSAFVNAIAGNSTVEGGSGITGFGLGFGNYHANASYTSGDYSALGNYGYDASSHVAWAVVDHNSDFAAISAVPEPSTWAMLVGGFGMLAFGQRLRRRSNA